jgi:uncharacterized membrane protein YfcA
VILAEIDLLPVIFLGLAAFSAGAIDAAVGGGGLIQVPALLLTFPNEPVANLFGTNKVASVFGTAAAGGRYLRQVGLPLSLILAVVGAAAIGSMVGASAVTHLPQSAIRPHTFFCLCARPPFRFSSSVGSGQSGECGD